MLDLLSDYIGTFISTLCGVAFVNKILKEDVKVKYYYVVLLCMVNSLVITACCAFNVVVLKSIIGYFLYVILFKVSFKFDNYKSFLTGFLYYILLFSGEIILFGILSYLFRTSGNAVYLEFGASLFANFLVSAICLFIGYLLRHLMKKLLEKRIKNKLLVYWLCIFACIILFLLVCFSTDKLNIETFLVLGMISVVLIVIFVSFYQTYKNNELAIKYDKLLDFIRKYETEIDKQRTLRHETKNQLLTIKSKLIDKDKSSNVIAYIDEIINDNNEVINHSQYSRLKYLPSNGIKGLFYFKVSEANEKGIDVNINISKEIKNSYLEKLSPVTFNQLGKILGIFLDNAIEGVEIASKKLIGIEVYCNSKGDIVIIISNTYWPIKPKKVGKVAMSTKSSDRGHGLLLVKTIIASNKMFKNETEITSELYVQKLTIKKQTELL